MKAARSPRSDKTKVKLLVVSGDELLDTSIEFLADHLKSGDLLVVNDAATLPASLHGYDARGNRLEVRLSGQLDERIWRTVTFGAGDWRTPTEDRPSPPRLKEGEEITFAGDFRARVLRENNLSPRLIDLEFGVSGEEFWRDIYVHGRPVQYSYLNDGLDLWSVQNVYSGRPWAVEMPSAGHAFTWRNLLWLAEKGIRIVPLTHAAGLSSTGDIDIDRALPLDERFDIPAATMQAITRTKARGGRVIAVGTSVVRALESSRYGLTGFTDLKIGPEHELEKVNGLLTGTHDVSESHYQLLQAFAPVTLLERMSRHLEERDYLTHEFGDLCLILQPGAAG